LHAPYDFRIREIFSAVAAQIPGRGWSSYEVTAARLMGTAGGFFPARQSGRLRKAQQARAKFAQ